MYVGVSLVFVFLSRDDATVGNFFTKAIYIRLVRLMCGANGILHYLVDPYTWKSDV